MLKKRLKKIINSFGYDVKKIRPNMSYGYEIFNYHKPDGSFDYERYKIIQEKANIQKINNVWVLEENISFLSDYIKQTLDTVRFGICHGTRRGKEQEWFRKYLNCDVIGTEISETAEQFPNTIQWDFHESKPEWVDAVDFIYSNSLDHSYDPEKCLDVWMNCVNKNGICILEHSSGHEESTQIDPFGAHISQMPYLILIWGKGKYFVRELINAPSKPNSLKYLCFIIIQRL